MRIGLQNKLISRENARRVETHYHLVAAPAA
jgi:hypothetical protein